MGIWFIVILLVIFVFLRAIIILSKIEIFKALPEKYVKIIFDVYTWTIAITILVTAMIFIFPDVWVDSVINKIIPESFLSDEKATLDSTAGSRGDIFSGTYGPLMAWFAAILTFAAFWAQYKANLQQINTANKQHDDIKLERFENRFFKLIDYHRENVAQMKYADPKRTGDGQNMNNKNNEKSDNRRE